MFKPGDLIRIKNAEGVWGHLRGKIGIFIREEENENLSQIVRPINCGLELKFAKEDLEYLCHFEDVSKVIVEENIQWI